MPKLPRFAQSRRHAAIVAATSFLLATPLAAQKQPTGYDDTPRLPGQRWRVHDGSRPQPPVVEPGEHFSELAAPPADAVVLFDGTDLGAWKLAGEGDAPAPWKLENGVMEVVPRSGSIVTREEFGDFQLHLEFATPAKTVSNSQGRGNSGVMIYGLYEVQVLDSFDNPTYPDGQAAALYGQYPPRVNASRSPGAWQTYDIVFEAPRWENGSLVKRANATVIHNGVVVHHRQELIGAVAHRAVGAYSEHPPQGPILLQDHGNPIRFRNIWIRPLHRYDEEPSR